MSRETGASNRLNVLFDTLLSGRGADPADTLDRISRLLTPERGAVGLRQFSRLLREAGALTAETSLRAACVMHMGAMPAHRIVQFLSISLPGGISLSQFELAVRFMFSGTAPVPDNMLYDLTQYTYLERRLLVQRSVELSDRLTRSMTPDMLLYLYLLSLREDLSNENVHLILLILRICFPALKIPHTTRGISPAEENEIAEAWKNVERSARYAEALGAPALRARRKDRTARESASFFLDKYFADGAQETAAETARKPGGPAGPKTAPGTGARAAADVSIGTPVARAAGTAGGGTYAGTAAGTRLRGGAKKGAGAARRGVGVSGRSSKPVPQMSSGRPAAAASASPPAPSGYSRADAAVRLRLAAPFGLAAALLIAVIVAYHRLPDWQGPRTQPPSPAVAPIGQPDSRPGPASTSRTVQKGDSLWKIYRSLQSEGALDTGWKDFLRGMTARNDIRDPDAIFPGNVLTITTGKK